MSDAPVREATRSSVSVDLVYAGRWEPDELAQLERDGVSVARTRTVVGALARLRAGGAGVVVAAGDEIDGREAQAFAAFRAAGARSVVAVYPARLSHRVASALGSGADAALSLPSHPGDLRRAVSIALGLPALSTAAVPVSTPIARTTGGDASLAALFADAAVVHRSVHDLERALDQTHAAFVRRSDARRCSLLLHDPVTDALAIRRASGLPADVAAGGASISGGLAEHVLRSGRPLLLADVANRPPELADVNPVGSGYGAPGCLLLPLRGGQSVVGVICLAERAGAAFDETDQRRLQFLADHVGQAVENALLLGHLRELAVVDELTGLYNRRFLQSALEREVERARRYDRRLTIGLFDLDLFKQYNDSCGHLAGDRALAQIGRILSTSLREVDIVARYGGEEFAVILPETSARAGAGAHNPFPFVERLRQRVEEATFPGEEQLPTGKLTLSGGLACFPHDADTADGLLAEADKALYAAKDHGRNRITYRGGG